MLTLELLQRGMERRLTLLTAPAGYGKSTVLLQWHDWLQAQGHLVAWLSLDADDDDPLQLLSYLLAALDAATPGLYQQAAQMLMSGSTIPDRIIASELINRIDSLGLDLFLIVDDLQNLKSTAVVDFLRQIISRAPPNLHLIMAAQGQADLLQSRLRAQGELIEVAASELQFQPDETATFLRASTPSPLDEAAVRQIHDAAEGWPVALQLATLSLRDPSRQSPLRSPSPLGEAAAIREYLCDSLLSHVPQDVRNFVLQTSILYRLNVDVCRAVTGGDAAIVASHLRNAAQLFLTPLDSEGHWYRYHQLVGEALRTLLATEIGAVALDTLHRRAFEWYAAAGLWADAVRHALACDAVDDLADSLEQCAMSMVMKSDVRSLLSWMRRLSSQQIRRRPVLSIAMAWALAHTHRLAEAEHLVAAAEENALQHGAGMTPWLRNQAMAVRTTLAILNDDPDGALALAEGYPIDDPQGDPLVTWAVRNVVAFGKLAAGEYEGARLVLAHHDLSTPRAHGNLFSEAYRTVLQGESYVMQAQFGPAIKLYRAAIAYFEAENGRHSVAAVLVACMLAELLYETNELDEIPSLLEDRLDIVDESCALDPVMRAYVTLARLKSARQQDEEARELLIWAEMIGKGRHWDRLTLACATERVRLSLAHGRFIEAKQTLSQITESSWPDGEVRQFSVMEARHFREYAEVEWLMAAGEFDGAYKRLEALAQTAEAAGRTYRAVQFQVRIATLLHRSGRPSDAIAHLVSALSISEASGMRRTFLDEGLSMKLLLDSLLESPPTGLSEPTLAYARSLAVLLQTLCPEVPPDSLPSRQTTDPLSQREREILELVAKARSNKEIARHLAISPETVKWHLKNIYGKLTAMNRRDAVRKGSFL